MIEKHQSVKARIDILTDAIYLTRYSDGHATACRELDPSDLAAAFGGVTIATPLLPPGCLSWSRKDGREKLVIYIPPQRRLVMVVGKKGDDRTPLDIPFSPLVLTGSGTNYDLYAVKQQPTAPSEPLFCAPFSNVNGSAGHVCWGDVRPPSAGPETIWPAFKLFVESDFNEHWSNGVSHEFPDDVRDLWRYLITQAAAVYPLTDLVTTGRTLGAIL